MTSNKWISFIILLIGIAAFGLYQWTARNGALPKSELIQEASAQEILDHVKTLNSPLVLINFWASWCEPCKEEFPSLMSIKKEFEPQGLRVVLVSLDDPGDLKNAETFMKQNSVDFPSFYKGTQSLNLVAQIYPSWTGAVPATILMGPDLKILDAWEGETSLQEFQERVKKYLKGT